MTKIGELSFKEDIVKILEKKSSLNQINQKEMVIRKQFDLTLDQYNELIEKQRRFVKNHNIPSLGYVTGFMDSKIIQIHGAAIVKQNDLKVMLCAFRNKKYHGHSLTYNLGKLIAL